MVVGGVTPSLSAGTNGVTGGVTGSTSPEIVAESATTFREFDGELSATRVFDPPPAKSATVPAD